MSDPADRRLGPQQADVLRDLMLARTAGITPATIAAVGNAPMPPDAARAARIDGAGLVIRMTTFAVDTDVPRIGRRTDVVVLHRALRPGPDTFRDHDRRLYLLAEPGRAFWEAEPIPAWWPHDLDLVPISNVEFTEKTRRQLRFGRAAVAWPTTGTLAVHLAHGLFPHARILLAGSSIGDPAAGRGGELAHQWGNAVSVTPEHRLRAERRALRRWQRDGWLEVLS